METRKTTTTTTTTSSEAKVEVKLPEEKKEATGTKVNMKTAFKSSAGKSKTKVTAKKKTEKGSQSPFRSSGEARRKRLKVFIFGDTGTLKTRTALQFPDPAVLDLERGTTAYEEEFNFGVLPETGTQGIMDAVTWLGENDHEYKTVVIDSITHYWEALQKKWSDVFLVRNRGKVGHKHEFYNLQPGDWGTIKAEMKELMRKLIALDMNVVVTAHEKALYADTSQGGKFMEKVGFTFDGEKKLPYLFDIVLRFTKQGDKFLTEVIKDRTNKLPKKKFETSFYAISACYDENDVMRKAQPQKPITEEQRRDIEEAIEKLKLPPTKVLMALEGYGVTRIEDLSESDAGVALLRLEARIASMKD